MDLSLQVPLSPHTHQQQPHNWSKTNSERRTNDRNWKMRTWFTKGGFARDPSGSFKNGRACSRHPQHPWKQVRGRTTITKWLERPKEPKLAVPRIRESEVWGGRPSVGSRWDFILASGNGEIFRCNAGYTNSCARSNMAPWPVAFYSGSGRAEVPVCDCWYIPS